MKRPQRLFNESERTPEALEELYAKLGRLLGSSVTEQLKEGLPTDRIARKQWRREAMQVRRLIESEVPGITRTSRRGRKYTGRRYTSVDLPPPYTSRSYITVEKPETRRFPNMIVVLYDSATGEVLETLDLSNPRAFERFSQLIGSRERFFREYGGSADDPPRIAALAAWFRQFE